MIPNENIVNLFHSPTLTQQKVTIYQAEALSLSDNDKVLFLSEQILFKVSVRKNAVVWEFKKCYAVLDFGVVYLSLKPGVSEGELEDYSL